LKRICGCGERKGGVGGGRRNFWERVHLGRRGDCLLTADVNRGEEKGNAAWNGKGGVLGG